MSKKGLVDHLYDLEVQKGLTRGDVEDVVDTFFLHLSSFIVRRKEHTCTKFGRFEVRKQLKRDMVHPSTGQTFHVPSKKKIVFLPSPVLKKKVNKS